MTNLLILGDRPYSSWSLRGWLLFRRFGIPTDIKMIDFGADTIANQLADYAPAKSVPTWRASNGAILSDTLAIAEELATRYPDAGLWPADPLARATARCLAAEMHSGFGALRETCPMNLWTAYSGFQPDAGVQADLRRIERIWDHARTTCAPDGPWLCGDYSVADAFFAPVAARIAGYGLQVSASAQAYVDAHLNDPAFRRWRAMGFGDGKILTNYKRDYPLEPWPGPTPMVAEAVENGTPENANCPYSGKPSTHFMELDGRIFGFCNAFCRDKTVPDPEAWPDFMKIYHS